MENNLLTTKELKELLKLSSPTIKLYMNKKIIPYFKIGGNYRFDKEKVLKALENK